MGFERFTSYRREAQNYKGEPISTDSLALKLREQCPYSWIKVRSNNKKIWPGEKRLENWDPINNKEDLGSVWMYRPNDNYDSVLFSLLYIRFQGVIYNTYKTIRNRIDVDEYLDATEEWMFQSIRHFNPQKDSSFKSLAYRMMKLCAINCVNRYTTQHTEKDENRKNKKDENGNVIKEIEYHILPTSLDSLLDEEGDYAFSNACIYPEYNNVAILREKYKNENNLLAWIITDLVSNDSYLLQNKKFCKLLDEIAIENNKTSQAIMQSINKGTLNKNFLKNIFNKLLNDESLLKEINFNNSFNITKKGLFTSYYNKGISQLQYDINQYELYR